MKETGATRGGLTVNAMHTEDEMEKYDCLLRDQVDDDVKEHRKKHNGSLK